MSGDGATVPSRMFGCWDRKYIQFGGGVPETDTRVLWLQTPSGMGDMRILKSRSDMRSYRSLSELSVAQLMELAHSDCSCGITVLDEGAQPMPTAEWLDGDYGFAQQVISNYPENGWMEWREERSCMMEFAPSGRYEEDWRLVGDSVGLCCHVTAQRDGVMCNYYIAGNHLMRAVDRTANPAQSAALTDIVALESDHRKRIETYLSSEFSYAKRSPGSSAAHYAIELSTLPWYEGDVIDMSWLLDAFEGLHNVGSEPVHDVESKLQSLQGTEYADLQGVQWRLLSAGYRHEIAS